MHTVDAKEPVYLIEIQVAGNEVDWAAITQPVEGETEDNWQVCYDGQQVPLSQDRWCFFFH